MNPHIKTIVKLFEATRYRHDLYTVFSDCMAAMAIAISNSVDPRAREAREQRYLDIVRRYDPTIIQTWPRILAELTMAMEIGADDILGSIFSQLELHNSARGQFFTPYSVCRLMAEMLIEGGTKARTAIEQKGYITVQEPACGAGAMVIAMAEALRAQGINYQKHLHVTAIDIDPRAAHMAYVQFSLLHIPAVVIVGNALTLDEREHWYTPAHILGGWNAKLASQTAGQPVQCVNSAPLGHPVAPLSAGEQEGRTRPKAAQLTLF